MTDSDVIRTRTEGHIFEVTLDRPKANAIDLVTSQRMGATFKSFRDDPDLRVCIVRTAGEKFFSAGWDLKAAAAGDSVVGDYGVGGFAGLQELRDLNKPVIAAIEGMCVGGWFELALSCDMILATEGSSFALPEIRAGTLADAATIKLPKRIPYHVAMDMLLTGEMVGALKAEQIGLVNRVVDEQVLDETVYRLAATIAGKSGHTLKIGKEAFYQQLEMGLAEAYDFTSEVMAKNLQAADAHEGICAFLDKRKPEWKDE